MVDIGRCSESAPTGQNPSIYSDTSHPNKKDLAFTKSLLVPLMHFVSNTCWGGLIYVTRDSTTRLCHCVANPYAAVLVLHFRDSQFLYYCELCDVRATTRDGEVGELDNPDRLVCGQITRNVAAELF